MDTAERSLAEVDRRRRRSAGHPGKWSAV